MMAEGAHNAVMDHAIKVRQGERTLAEVPEGMRDDVRRALRDNVALREYHERTRPVRRLESSRPPRLGRVTTF